MTRQQASHDIDARTQNLMGYFLLKYKDKEGA